MELQLFPGTEVQIVIGNIIAVGEIRYAKPIGVDFDHGVAVREVCYLTGEPSQWLNRPSNSRG